MRVCFLCDTELPEDANFCGRCGRRAASSRSRAARVGTTVLGRYQLLEEIGAGGAGTVYRALQRSGHLQRAVAVKVLHPEHTSSKVARRRFLRESELVVGLRHPNVVRVFDAGETDDGALCVVMELLEGETLASRLSRGPLPPDTAREVLRMLCEALAEAHARGIVHRDVKPENVMLCEGVHGRVHAKLFDFGVAHVPEAPGYSALTQRGALVGTLPYMSPEQLRGERVDPRTDVYALGLVAHEMLTGDSPYGQPGSPVEWIHTHLEAEPRSVEDHPVGAELSPAERDALRRAIAKAPADRPADAHALALALKATEPRPSVRTPPPTAHSDEGRALSLPPARRPWLRATFAALLLVAFGVGGSSFTKSAAPIDTALAVSTEVPPKGPTPESDKPSATVASGEGCAAPARDC